MSLCPHCLKSHGLPEFRVWLSAPLWPAKCRNCEAHFCPSRVTSAVVAEIVFFPFGLMAVAASSRAWVSALFIIGFLVAYVAVRALAPLVELSSSRARRVQ